MKGITMALVALLTSGASVLVGVPAGAHEDDDGPATYVVTLRNLTTGQYLTPPNWAAHDGDFEVFATGDAASPEVQAVAENGDVGALAAALAAQLDATGAGVSGVGAPAPIGPGQSATWTVTTDEEHLSLVAMVICTNDGFAGADGRKLPKRSGTTRTYRVQAHDAGTEINTEARGDLVPAPFCGPGMGSGTSDPALAENGEIRRHRGIRGVGDLGPEFDWDGPVAQLIVTRV